MKTNWFLPAVFALSFATSTSSQSLTPEQISAMVDRRVNDLNPYQTLLNDPDPERSRLAMQVMLESGDADLSRMALEFGLLSPSPTVKRAAFEAWLASGPVLTIKFDGNQVKDKDFADRIKRRWNGTVSGKVGYWKMQVSDYLEEEKCFSNTRHSHLCFVTINGDGIFLSPDEMNGRATISDDGSVSGVADVNGISDPVPFSIKILD